VKDKRLVFLDLKTTGLDEKNDNILEVGVVITDAHLNELADRNWIVDCGPTTKVLLEANEVTKEMHTKNGLINELSNGL
jgi:oligoribonuclease